MKLKRNIAYVLVKLISSSRKLVQIWLRTTVRNCHAIEGQTHKHIDSHTYSDRETNTLSHTSLWSKLHGVCPTYFKASVSEGFVDIGVEEYSVHA